MQFVCNRGDTTLLNTEELWRTIALICANNGQYYTVSWQTPGKEVRPSPDTVVTNS